MAFIIILSEKVLYDHEKRRIRDDNAQWMFKWNDQERLSWLILNWGWCHVISDMCDEQCHKQNKSKFILFLHCENSNELSRRKQQKLNKRAELINQMPCSLNVISCLHFYVQEILFSIHILMSKKKKQKIK